MSKEEHQVDIEKMILKQKCENCFPEKEDDSQNEHVLHLTQRHHTKSTA